MSLNLFTYVFVNMGIGVGHPAGGGGAAAVDELRRDALVTLLLGMGILMSVATHRQLNKS